MSTITDAGVLSPALGGSSESSEAPARRQTAQAIPYRPEIDGLRAVAVLSVVFYHAFPQWLPGGFIGVDVFFVISGFLITSIIVEEWKLGQFAFVRFYERRARRLLPPIAPVLVVTTALCFLLLSKEQLQDFAVGLGANAVFASNWYFLSKISYFDSPGVYTPLLHTWSLSVEEQFYFVFPLLLLLGLKLSGHRLRYLCLSLLAASFCYASYLVWEGLSDAAFYNAVARFWELLAGSLLAIWKPRHITPQTALIMGLAGLVAIAIALFRYDHETLFPGPSAALPVFGTALVILATESGGSVQRILSCRPLVGIGLISYALYLWHWPLLVGSRLINPNLGTVWIITILLASGLLAWISFILIERPIRARRALRTQRSVWVFSIVLLAAMLAISLALQSSRLQHMQQLTQASVERILYPKQKVALLHRLEAAKQQYMKNLNLNFTGRSGAYSPRIHAGWTCSYDKKNSVNRLLECLEGQASKDNNILVMGDSIGRDTLHALRLAFPSQHFIMLHASSCPPGTPTCFPNLQEILSRLRSSVPIKAVVINFRYRPDEFRNVELGIEPAKDLTPNVYLFGVSPVFAQNLTDYVKSLKAREMPPMTIPAREDAMTRWDYSRLLDEARSIAKKHNVVFVNVFPFFCPHGNSCRLWVNDRYGRPIFWDNQHLTPEGIRSFSEYLRSLPELGAFTN